MENHYINLSLEENTYLEMQTAINGIVNMLGRQFYWASREDMSDSFTKEKADVLYDIMRIGNEHHELMVRCYWKTNMPLSDYELGKVQEWIQNINKNNDLFDDIHTKSFNRHMESIERCFETITSNEWIR